MKHHSPDHSVKVSIKLTEDDDGSPILQINLRFTWLQLVGLASKIKWASVAWHTQTKATNSVQTSDGLDKVPKL